MVFRGALNSTGTALLYSTYIGGNSDDWSNAIAVDSSGNAYITGYTRSTNFPTTAGAYQTTFAGDYNVVFVTKLNSAGTALVYSTYLGGSGGVSSNAIAVDSSGNAYITGETSSTNFPMTPGAYQTTFPGGYSAAFVTKLNSAGTALLYSTYLGGIGGEKGHCIAVDSSGNAYVAGRTNSTNFPTTAGAYQTTGGGGAFDAFVTKLNSTGTALIYSTYLGGNRYALVQAIALDSSGNAYITGSTTSDNFPTTAGAYQAVLNGGGSGGLPVPWDAFVAKFSFESAATTTTTTTVTSSKNPSTSGASVTFTAIVSGSSGTPTGTVTFMDGTTTLGTGTLSSGKATYTSSSLNASAHSITAVYGGDSSFATSTSSVLTQTVTAVIATTTTTLTSSVNPSTPGEAITFTVAVASSSGAPTGTVSLMYGSMTLVTATLSGGQATYTARPLGPGVYPLTAVYVGGSSFASSTSSVLTQTVATNITDDYTGTYAGRGVTIHLQQVSKSLFGRFQVGNSGGNIGGIVDSSGRAQAWAYWDDSTSGSGVLAGRLTLSGNQATFSFGGGRSSSGKIDETILSDMTKSALSGSTTVTSSSSATNYAGTYTTLGLNFSLTQSGSTLSGAFSSGGLTGNAGGFIDSSGRAYVWVYWDSLFTGFGVVAGNLTVSGSQATFNFGGGRGSDGRIDEIVLSGMNRQ